MPAPPRRAAARGERAAACGAGGPRAHSTGSRELLEHRLEQQGGAGEVERAPGGAERIGEHGREHVFVWCEAPPDGSPARAGRRRPTTRLYRAQNCATKLQRDLQNVCSSGARVAGARRSWRPGSVAVRLPPQAMDSFVIQGGAPLTGTVIPAGNKNGALALIAASVLTDAELRLGNVPRIRDVDAMLEIIAGLGGARRLDRRERGHALRARTST